MVFFQLSVTPTLTVTTQVSAGRSGKHKLSAEIRPTLWYLQVFGFEIPSECNRIFLVFLVSCCFLHMVFVPTTVNKGSEPVAGNLFSPLCRRRRSVSTLRSASATLTTSSCSSTCPASYTGLEKVLNESLVAFDIRRPARANRSSFRVAILAAENS